MVHDLCDGIGALCSITGMSHYTKDIMKYIFLIATLALQFLSVLTLKLLDNFPVIIGIFILSIVVGGLIKFSKPSTNLTIANIGWGLFYGSITSLGLIIAFTIWLSFNFPK